MSFLAWIIVGLVAGWLAGTAMKGSGYGMGGNIVIGILGALVGGYLSTMLFATSTPVDGINITSILTAALGAAVLIAIVRAMPGHSPV